MSLLDVHRQGSGDLFVWLHGFTQTRDSAHQFRSILAGASEVLVVDLPGHGTLSTVEANLPETADLLARDLPSEPFTLGGYSFGARVALHFALRHAERLRGLVLLGASRGIADEVERNQRRERDEALALRVESVGVDAFLDEWLSQPMFTSLPADPIERAARSRDATGLANALRRAGTGTQEWLGPRLASIVTPTLAMAGAKDLKFSDEASAIGGGVQNGEVVFIEDAHHAAHLERPARTARAVQEFIERRAARA